MVSDRIPRPGAEYIVLQSIRGPGRKGYAPGDTFVSDDASLIGGLLARGMIRLRTAAALLEEENTQLRAEIEALQALRSEVERRRTSNDG